MIEREIAEKIKELAAKFPVVSLTGPRQSGKTTLIKSLFPDKAYVTLEDVDMRIFASSDPRGFLASYPNGAILDEVQRVPDLFSYLQGIVDQHGIAGEFILSGSQNFLLMESISQSLAGRAAILKLMPFSNRELTSTKFFSHGLEERIFTGGYPPIYDKDIAPSSFFSSYIQTYVERDIRQLKNIHDLGLFARFLKLCAARTGQLINFSSLAADCGISHFTAQSWLSLLQTSYIIYLLQPHHINFTKRLTKMPKLYFYDTGLACHFLNITESSQLKTHFMRGSLFENMVIMEIVKHYTNMGQEAPVFFWRDKTGNEIDCLIELTDGLQLIEIKSAHTFHSEFAKNIEYYEKLNQDKYLTRNFIVYAGDTAQQRTLFTLTPWNQDLFSK
ncbi:MAG: ATP-binding protein [Bacteroidales bacterium]|nr:ATP-binding protein [Bacteroidales bacterium]